MVALDRAQNVNKTNHLHGSGSLISTGAMCSVFGSSLKPLALPQKFWLKTARIDECCTACTGPAGEAHTTGIVENSRSSLLSGLPLYNTSSDIKGARNQEPGGEGSSTGLASLLW